jgi:putative ABC transport system substrate-binding protein
MSNNYNIIVVVVPMQLERYIIATIGCALLLCLLATSVSAQEVAIIKSINIKPYNEALAGFQDVCKASYEEFTVAEVGAQEVQDKLQEMHPRVIFAIGLEALKVAMDVKNVPIVYAMVLNSHSIILSDQKIIGISMNIPAEKQLATLLEILPKTKRIGLVYDPQNTAPIVREAREAASSLGVTLVAKEVSSPGEVPLAIRDMKGKIDAYWALPDVTVLTRETIKFLYLFSFENNIAILAFAPKYVDMGALLSLSIDASDVGRQAGELANRLLSGATVKGTNPGIPPRKAVVSFNRKTAKTLGIKDETVTRLQGSRR